MTELAVDAMWRRFRRDAASFLALCEALAPLGWETLREQGLTGGDARRVRPWAPLPGLVSWNVEDMLARGECPAGQPAGSPALDVVRRVHAREPLGQLAGTATALVGWRGEKRVYRLSPALAAGLRRARWPGAYPAAHVLLPAPAIALEVPADPDDRMPSESLVLSLDLATRREAAGALELRVARVPTDAPGDGPPLLTPVAIAALGVPGDGTTLDQALGAARAAVEASVSEVAALMPGVEVDTAPLQDAWSGGNPSLRVAINAALYLLGDDDIVAQVSTRRTPRDVQALDRDPRRRDLAPPQVWDVGVRYARVIERYVRDLSGVGVGAPADGTSATGRTVRPHIRGPHTHLYWTGPGRHVPRVRFLPPIPVKGGLAESEAPTPTVRPVR